MTRDQGGSWTAELRGVAQRVADLLPAVAEEVVLTGSVSRGVADELSDVEMLVVTATELDLTECFEHARRAGLAGLDTWGAQRPDVARVFGYYRGTPVEMIWWSRKHAEAAVAAIAGGAESAAAEALANGSSLRTVGLLEAWQGMLRVYPESLAARRIEDAAVAWGGFHPTGFLTLARPNERLALVENLYADAVRVLTIVYALNRTWAPTTKRLADRLAPLALKPNRLQTRIEEALTTPDPLDALLVMCGLQIETVDLAPPGPNVERARSWLRDVREVLRGASAVRR